MAYWASVFAWENTSTPTAAKPPWTACLACRRGVPVLAARCVQYRERGGYSFKECACMPAQSAGLMMYRKRGEVVEVFLAHPGGPFWKNRDEGAWTLPKGLVEDGEDPLAAACREFAEETGIEPHGPFLPLGAIRQKSGKNVTAWAFAGDADPAAVRCNTFRMEWPPRSGRFVDVPEIDRCDWFDPVTARTKLNPAQSALIDRLLAALAAEDAECAENS